MMVWGIRTGIRADRDNRTGIRMVWGIRTGTTGLGSGHMGKQDWNQDWDQDRDQDRDQGRGTTGLWDQDGKG